jgi:hypothetical protein
MVKWLYGHYVITAVIVIYYLILAGYGTWRVFENILTITGPGVTAYGTLMALPAAAVALLKWRIDKDNP